MKRFLHFLFYLLIVVAAVAAVVVLALLLVKIATLTERVGSLEGIETVFQIASGIMILAVQGRLSPRSDSQLALLKALVL